MRMITLSDILRNFPNQH